MRLHVMFGSLSSFVRSVLREAINTKLIPTDFKISLNHFLVTSFAITVVCSEKIQLTITRKYLHFCRFFFLFLYMTRCLIRSSNLHVCQPTLLATHTDCPVVWTVVREKIHKILWISSAHCKRYSVIRYIQVIWSCETVFSVLVIFLSSARTKFFTLIAAVEGNFTRRSYKANRQRRQNRLSWTCYSNQLGVLAFDQSMHQQEGQIFFLLFFQIFGLIKHVIISIFNILNCRCFYGWILVRGRTPQKQWWCDSTLQLQQPFIPHFTLAKEVQCTSFSDKIKSLMAYLPVNWEPSKVNIVYHW